MSSTRMSHESVSFHLLFAELRLLNAPQRARAIDPLHAAAGLDQVLALMGKYGRRLEVARVATAGAGMAIPATNASAAAHIQ